MEPPIPELPLEPSEPIPQRIGRFDILRPLGQGGMGQVFLARDPAIGREVALKTISAEHLQAPKARDRFLNEAKAAGALSHSNLITIHEFGEDGGTLFLVMEYLEGQDLSVLLRKRALTPMQSLDVMAQVCDGLAYAHAKGVLHRDVKPSNVRVVDQGGRLVAKLMDFGVARLPDSHLTATGDRVGTLSYMAPEYLRGAAPSVQCDLYPVGMMLHQALTGELPQLGPTLPRGLSSRSKAPASDSTRELPPRLIPLVSKALAADSADRFQTADAFAKALRAAQSMDTGFARMPEPPPMEPVQHSRSPYGWIAAVLVAGAAAGTGWMLWKRPASAAPAQALPSVASSAQAPPPEAHPQPSAVQPPSAPLMPAPQNPIQQPAQQPPQQAPPNGPAAPQDSGVDLSSAEATVREHPQMALLDAERALRYRPNDPRALALRVAAHYWSDRYGDMLSALQAAKSAGVEGNQLGGYPVIHAMLDNERESHRIPRDTFMQMIPYLPTPPGQGQGGQGMNGPQGGPPGGGPPQH